MSDDAEFSESGWRFVALFRFEQTNKDGKKVFFNFQAVPSSTSKEILSIFRQHSDLIEFYDEPEPNKPANDGVLDLTAEGKLFSGKVHAQNIRFSWQFKKSTSLLMPGEELDCKVDVRWVSGKVDAVEPLHGTPEAHIQFGAFNELLSWSAVQLLVLPGPRKQHYKNLARTVKVLAEPGDSQAFRVKCLVPSRENLKADRLSLLIYTNVDRTFRGIQAIYEWTDFQKPGERFVTNTSSRGWLTIKHEYGLTQPNVIPYALKVKLNQVKDGREYFTILEGPLAGHKASVKLADDGKSYLSPEILHGPASFLTYSKKNQTLTLDINGVKTDYLIIMSNEDPIPNGKYDLEIPYEPHHLYGEPYENFSLYAKTWFRIGHTGDRYLHLGEVSRGCITVRAGDNKPGAWDEIYRRLIVSRMGDSMNVGTVSVVD